MLAFRDADEVQLPRHLPLDLCDAVSREIICHVSRTGETVVLGMHAATIALAPILTCIAKHLCRSFVCRSSIWTAALEFFISKTIRWPTLSLGTSLKR